MNALNLSYNLYLDVSFISCLSVTQKSAEFVVEIYSILFFMLVIFNLWYNCVHMQLLKILNTC